MSRRLLIKLMLAVALLVLVWGVGTSPARATSNLQCGLYQTYYYSTGGHCNTFCDFITTCFGNVSGTIVRQVPGHCYACT